MPDGGRIAGPIVVPLCIQTRLIWTLANGRIVHNVLHGRVLEGFPADVANAEAIFAHIKASAAWTAFKAFLNSGTSLDGVDFRNLDTPNNPLVQSTGGAAAGTGGGDALPEEVALVTTLRTARAGRAFRGRVYLPGFDAGALTATGVADAAVVAAATNFVQEVRVAMSTVSMTMCIAHPARQAYTGKNGLAIPARLADTVDVTSVICQDALFDSQRRRK